MWVLQEVVEEEEEEEAKEEEKEEEGEEGGVEMNSPAMSPPSGKAICSVLKLKKRGSKSRLPIYYLYTYIY